MEYNYEKLTVINSFEILLLLQTFLLFLLTF